MKIISNFKDYYDVIQQYGLDSSIVFERISNSNINYNENKFSLPKESLSIDNNIRKKIESNLFSDYLTQKLINDWKNISFSCKKNNTSFPELHHFVIVINAKPINTFFLTKLNENNDNIFIKKNISIEEAFNELIKNYKLLNNKNDIFFSFYKRAKNHSFEEYKKNTYFIQRYQENENIENSLSQLHKDLKNPIIFIYNKEQSYYKSEQEYYTNIPLRYLGITDVFGSIEKLSQEISYCIGNVILNKNAPPVEVENNIKILGHGFDLKESFRHRK